jgi:hypothetical protein
MEVHKMSGTWVLEVQPDAGSGAYGINLAITDAKSGNRVPVVASCPNLERFDKEILALKAQMEQLLGEARQKVAEFEKKTLRSAEPEDTSEVIWKKMQASGSEQEMTAYFNSFGSDKRLEVAEYILTHASMFKGWGPVFAEHYNMESHTLEG